MVNIIEITLSGAAQDTLYKLGKYGAQDDGDLPSKAGMIELIQKGLANKDYNLEKPNYLTASGLMAYDGLNND